MEPKDISYIRRFLGVIEGVALSLPNDTQSMIGDYIAVVDEVLDKYEKGGDK